MGRPKKKQVEMRSYDLTNELHLVVHRGSEWRISPVESLVLHFHNCFEVGICLTQSAFVRFGEDRVPIQAGDIVCVARNVAHTIWSAPGQESEWCFLHLDPELILGEQMAGRMPDFQGFLKMLSDCHLVLRAAENAWADVLLRQMVQESERREAGFSVCFGGLCTAFFTRLLRIYSQDEPGERAVTPTTTISPALDYLYSHYQEKFSLETLAQICHMSPTNFRRRFGEETGTNPLAFLHQVRILKSCAILRTTGADVAEAAAQVGYTSMSSFNRHFLELAGCTPSAWRNMRTDRQERILLSLNGWQRAETDEEIEERNRGV